MVFLVSSLLDGFFWAQRPSAQAAPAFRGSQGPLFARFGGEANGFNVARSAVAGGETWLLKAFWL